jgi:excisionase family DNA binding protein
MSEHWLTVADVADELEVSRRTVTGWIARGELRGVRLPGGRLRIRLADLQAMLRAGDTVGGRLGQDDGPGALTELPGRDTEE